MIRRTFTWWRHRDYPPGITRGALHSFIFLTVLMLMLSAVNLLYTAHEITQEAGTSRQHDRALCAAITSIAPASAQARQKLAAAFRQAGC